MKRESTFFGAAAARTVRENIRRYESAARQAEEICKEAAPFLDMTDDEIWSLMPSHTITRSWMVWSEGYCPKCGRDVRMYFWRHDPFLHPWKVACPHCGELFPKNDFGRFYESGLDDNGIFRKDRADRTLLFNEDDPDGEERDFGVDDGEGYTKDGKRWRFIGNYLIYSRWKQQVVGGLKALSGAYFYFIGNSDFKELKENKSSPNMC